LVVPERPVSDGVSQERRAIKCNLPISKGGRRGVPFPSRAPRARQRQGGNQPGLGVGGGCGHATSQGRAPTSPPTSEPRVQTQLLGSAKA